MKLAIGIYLPPYLYVLMPKKYYNDMIRQASIPCIHTKNLKIIRQGMVH